MLRGSDSPRSTQMPIAQVVGAYVRHIRSYKTPKIAQTDIYYLREAFGPVCPELEITSRRPSVLARKRPPKPSQDRRRRAVVIEAGSFEQINTVQIAAFISGRFWSHGLAPTTAKRAGSIGLAVRQLLREGRNWHTN